MVALLAQECALCYLVCCCHSGDFFGVVYFHVKFAWDCGRRNLLSFRGLCLAFACAEQRPIVGSS
jgi:hypothetical protein